MGDLARKTSGDLLLLRNKLYVFLDADGRAVKSGLHGFWGTTARLLALWRARKRVYSALHIWKIREAARQNKVALSGELRKRELLIDWKKYQDVVRPLALERNGNYAATQDRR